MIKYNKTPLRRSHQRLCDFAKSATVTLNETRKTDWQCYTQCRTYTSIPRKSHLSLVQAASSDQAANVSSSKPTQPRSLVRSDTSSLSLLRSTQTTSCEQPKSSPPQSSRRDIKLEQSLVQTWPIYHEGDSPMLEILAHDLLIKEDEQCPLSILLSNESTKS